MIDLHLHLYLFSPSYAKWTYLQKQETEIYWIKDFKIIYKLIFWVMIYYSVREILDCLKCFSIRSKAQLFSTLADSEFNL